jgi:hypothetical protein
MNTVGGTGPVLVIVVVAILLVLVGAGVAAWLTGRRRP